MAYRHSSPITDQKPKKKKKSKRKGNAQATATDVAATPTQTHDVQNSPDDEDEAENDEQEVEDSSISPAKGGLPDEDPATELITNGVKTLLIEDSNDATTRIDALIKDPRCITARSDPVAAVLGRATVKACRRDRGSAGRAGRHTSGKRECRGAIPKLTREGEHYTIAARREVESRRSKSSLQGFGHALVNIENRKT